MKYFHSAIVTIICIFSLTAAFAQPGNPVFGPALKLKEFVIWSNASTQFQNDTLGGVNIKSSGIINGGKVGAKNAVNFFKNNTIYADIHAGHRITMDSGNVFRGNASANNTNGQASLPAFYAGRGNQIGQAGNGGVLTINGNVLVSNASPLSSVLGPVNLQSGYSYSGPTPANGVTQSTITVPSMPVMPKVHTFPAFGTLDITGSTTLVPGSYQDMILPGNAGVSKVTFSTPGIYVFKSINNSGSNEFNFIIPAGSTDVFKICVHDVASLANLSVKVNDIAINTNNDPRAALIYLETHGGLAVANAIQYSFLIGNCNWLGTVYAPYAGMSIGGGANSRFAGAMISGGVIDIANNMQVDYVPSALAFNYSIAPYYPNPDDGKVTDLIGSELTQLAAYFSPQSPDSSQNIFKIFPATTTELAKVMIEVIAQQGQYTNLLNHLVSEGLTYIVNNGPGSLIITGKYPIIKLPALNSRPDLIRFARPLYQPITNSGLTYTLGDSAMNSGLVKNGYAISGAGVKVGVISDSYDRSEFHPLTTRAENDLGYDLPASVEVLLDYPFGVASDEGRAMMQIVHDVAPGASLAFRTGFISAGDMAQGIRELATQAHCDIIVDDVTYITEPFLKDGVIAQAVNQVVTNNSVTYFSAAGNFGKKGFDGTYDGISCASLGSAFTGLTAHNFGGGSFFQPVTLSPGNYTIALQWNDDLYSLGSSATGTSNDLDIYLVDDAGNILFGFNRVNLAGDPLEVLPFKVIGDGVLQANLVIVRAGGNTSGLQFKYIVFRGNLSIPGYSGASTLVGQANAEKAIAVGAVFYQQSPAFGVAPASVVAETFSSMGGTLVNGQNRNKPDFAAPDGGNVTINLGPDYPGDPDAHSNFMGTSAAAPHAAAVAALIKEGKQKFSSASISQVDMKELLKSTSTAIGSAGSELITGAGLINADAAMRTFANPTPYITGLVTNPVLTPSIPPPASTAGPLEVTVMGKNLHAQTRVWFNNQWITPTSVSSSAVTLTINNSFTGDPSLQLYTPPKSSSGLDGGYSNKVYFYHSVKNVVVTANPATKKYGEDIPVFTATITIDGESLPASITPADLGLGNLQMTTTANKLSPVGFYPINIVNPIPHLANSQELLEKYNYSFNISSLQILRLPLKITPAATTFEYGKFPGSVDFTYDFDRTKMTNSNEIENAIKAQHKKFISDNAVAVINNGNSLQPAAFNNLSTMASYQSIRNARKFSVQNGGMSPLPSGTLPIDQIGVQRFVVDVAAQSITNYNLNKSSSNLVEAYPGEHARGLISAKTLASGPGNATASLPNGQLQALVNGQLMALVNGQLQALVNGQLQALVNGQLMPLVNGDLVFLVNGQLMALVNGQLQALVNGQLMALVNTPDGEKLAVVTNTVLASGQLQALVNGYGTVNIVANGQLQALVNGDIYAVNPFANNGSLLPLVNGQLQALVNGQLQALVNGQLQALVNGQLQALVNTNNLGGSNSNTNTAVIIDADDITLQNGYIGGMFSINTITSLEVGTQKMIPGAMASENFDVSYSVGTIEITPAVVTVTADDKQKIAGESNPELTYKTYGLAYGETFITPPSISTTATTNSPFGTYPITVNGGTLNNHYTLVRQNAMLTISQVELYITADLKFINQGAPLPVFTSTITGQTNGDVITGITYTASSVNTSIPGEYINTPMLAASAYPKYHYNLISGKFYVNPYGNDAKKVKPKLECVEEITGHPSGFRYIAHFSYENRNSTPVYVPHGPDNLITTTGGYSGTPPVVFYPGTHYFDIYFSGNKLTWSISTNEKKAKSASASEASANSNKCKAKGITTRSNMNLNHVDPAPMTIPEEPVYNKYSVMPNPVKDKLVVTSPVRIASEKDVTVMDAGGRPVQINGLRKTSDRSVELNVSGIQKGVYFIRLRSKEGFVTLRFVKL